MKTGKKVLGAVLAAAMALSSITPVFAADKVKIAPYKDIDAPEDAPQIFKDMVEYTGTIKDSVGEYFDYDTCSTLVDTSRNGILNMMLSDSAENTAQTIQADIDANRPQS